MRVFSTLFFLASLAVSGLATVAQVKADIVTITTQLNTLDASITNFPTTGGSLLQALTIHTNSVTLGGSIDKGTTDVKGTPPPISEADARSILTSVEAIESTIDHALTQIVAKKAAFQALPVGGIPALVKQDLSNLSASTSNFEAALIALAPTDLQAEGTALKSRIDAAFAAAVAAYA